MSTYGWTRSLFCSNGGCVEVAWISSSACAAGDCVEVCLEADEVLLRDSKLGEQSPILRFTVDEWEAFRAGVEYGEFTPEVLAAASEDQPAAQPAEATDTAVSVAAGVVNANTAPAPNSPAGRSNEQLPDEKRSADGSAKSTAADQPGSHISDEAVEHAAAQLKSAAEAHGAFTTAHTMRNWARQALAAAYPLLREQWQAEHPCAGGCAIAAEAFAATGDSYEAQR